MTKVTNFNEYAAATPAEHRAALKALRAQVKKLYPKATEHISYRVPLFKHDGHPLCAISSAKTHLGLFVWSGSVLGTLKPLLKGYDTGKGVIRFTPEKPLPLKIIKTVLAARAKEIKERWPEASKATKKKAKA